MNPLEIVVTGNIDGAKSSLQTVQAELGKTALAAQKSDSAIDTFGKTMARFGSSGAQSIALLQGKIEALKAEMVNIKDISVLSQFNKEIEASELQLGRMSNAGKTGFNELGMTIEKTGNPLSHGYGILRKIAYVLPGIGISGLVAFATGPIIDFVQELMKANDAENLLKDNIKNISDINKEAAENVAKQTSSLSVLYSIATDVNRSMSARVGAIKELQSEFPDYFKNISQENILNGNAKSAYDALTNSLIANALAKAQLDKITAIGVKRGDAQSQIDDLIAERKRQLDAVKGSIVSTPSIGGSTGAASTTISPAQQKEDINTYFDRQLKPLKSQIDSFNKQIDNIKGRLNPSALLSDDGKSSKNSTGSGVLAVFDAQIKVLEDYKNNIAMTAGEIASVNAQIKKLKDERDKYDPSSSKTKKTNPFEISLKGLEDNYKKAQALLVTQYYANTSDAKKNTTAVNDLLLKAQENFLEQKLALIKKYGKKEGDVALEIAKNQKAIIDNQLKFTFDQISTLPKVQNAPAINFSKATTGKIDPKPVYELSDAIKRNIKLQEQMKELLASTAEVLNKTVGPAFDTLFMNILEGSGNAFQAFGEALKQLLVQLGAAILKAALFSAILSVISGGAANAAHGGVSFGQEFLKMFKFSNGGPVKGFASGGAINGPGTSTSDSILARVSRGEYIMNASAVSKFGSNFFDGLNSGMLPKFNRGGPVGSNMILASDNHIFIPDVTLKGQDLIIAFNRANQRASRNG